MSAIVLPLLMILGALGGMLLVVGRKLPVVRSVLKELPEERSSHESIEGTLQPRAATVSPPRRRSVRAWMTARPTRWTTRISASGNSLRELGRLGQRAGKFFTQLFSRPPKIRPPFPRSAIPRVEESPTPRSQLVQTTTDVQRTTGHPVRFPETTHSPRSSRESGGNPEPPSTKAARERETSVSDRPELDRTPLPEPATTTITPGDVPPALEQAPATAVPAHASAAEGPQVPPAPPRLSEEPRRRRIVGRVHQRRAREGAPLSSPGTTGSPADTREILVVPAERQEGLLAQDDATTTDDIAKLIAAGSLGRAESHLIDLLSKNPRDTTAYRLLGTIYLKREDYQQAQEVFEEALRRAPDEHRIYGFLGHAYFALGEYGKALAMYQRAHDADETNLEYLERLLTILSRMDRRPLVRVTAQKILQLNPTHADAKKALEKVGAR